MTREELKQDLKKAAVTAMTVLSTLNAPTAQASEQAPTEDDKIIERTEYVVPNKYPQDDRVAVREIDITVPNADSRVKITGQEESYKEFTPELSEENKVEQQREEYDRKNRLRLKEDLKMQANNHEANALQRMYGYGNNSSYGNYQYSQDEYDKKGRVTENRVHSGFYGNSASLMSDIVVDGRRGKDIYKDGNRALDDTFEVRHFDGPNKKETTVNYTDYNRKGEQKAEYTGTYSEGSEKYTKEKGDKFTEVSFVGGKYKGHVSEEDADGEINTEELSERKVKRQVRKIRNLLERKLKKETGAKSIEAYEDLAIPRDSRKQAPLSIGFDGDFSQEKYDATQAEITQENSDLTSKLEKGEKVIVTKRESEETKRRGSLSNEEMRQVIRQQLIKTQD